jgi:hypothetical protein
LDGDCSRGEEESVEVIKVVLAIPLSPPFTAPSEECLCGFRR